MNAYKDLTQEERTSMLDLEMKAQGITRRDDSKLCNKFIERGELTVYNSPAKIARRMAEMHYLYTHTEYADLFLHCRDKYKEFTKDGSVYYILPQVEAEFRALDGEPYPETWPWQTKTEN